ncbi:hypothetical protein K1T71_007894 [Dendrolimus kikuchii]|uniref:Uncharacterized protein n=1 Tax=Dendrolimus kikuchii TaxID=765133 RepID=A0ACC1CYL1_9NEOP|nr:hypothetical protein K1T71_007894 [Dendrolimus kikuchii]
MLANCAVTLYLNDECKLRDGIGTGMCTLADDCEEAHSALLQRKPHKLRRCGFDNFSEIVCCPLGVPSKHGIPRRAETECNEILKTSVPPLNSFIYGGEVASAGEFPFVVALGYNKGDGIDYNCGGSIISKDFVLTAAHCIDTLEGIRPTVVRSGVINISDSNWNDETDVNIADYILHPNYTTNLQYNDLCLLRLSRPLQFSLNVHAVCLETNHDDPKESLSITGWGQTNSQTLQKSNVLLKTNVTAVSLSECSKTFNKNNFRKLPRGLSQEMLCAGDPAGAHDACKGDSGGPILVPTIKSQYRLVGVTSFGKGCGSPDPGVYTRVSRYIDWIEPIVWPN